MPRLLNVNLLQLEDAMFQFPANTEFEMQGYLDQETGEVIVLGGDISFDAFDPGDEPPDDLSDWELEEWHRCRKVMGDSSGRYVEIPSGEDSDPWQLRADFADQLPDGELRDRLSQALRGTGAFRRFKDELRRHPDVREAWHEYENNAQRQAAIEWLASIDIQTTWKAPNPA